MLKFCLMKFCNSVHFCHGLIFLYPLLSFILHCCLLSIISVHAEPPPPKSKHRFKYIKLGITIQLTDFLIFAVYFLISGIKGKLNFHLWWKLLIFGILKILYKYLNELSENFATYSLLSRWHSTSQWRFRFNTTPKQVVYSQSLQNPTSHAVEVRKAGSWV